jgi:hypothetical protein
MNGHPPPYGPVSGGFVLGSALSDRLKVPGGTAGGAGSFRARQPADEQCPNAAGH